MEKQCRLSSMILHVLTLSLWIFLTHDGCKFSILEIKKQKVIEGNFKTLEYEAHMNV